MWSAFLNGLASIAEGMASICIFPLELEDDPKIQEILNRSDAEAFAADWEAIGEDFRKVIDF
jgi:hypothetical protein